MKLDNCDILKLNTHDIETCDGLNTHSYNLINLIVTTYYNIRMMHICKLDNEGNEELGTRQILNRSIIVQHL